MPQTNQNWNNLPNETRKQDAVKVSLICCVLLFHKRPQHGMQLVIREHLFSIHCSMQMLCIPLNDHLSDHLYLHIHVIDNCDCACGFARETNKHILLHFPLFNERTDFKNKVNDLAFKQNITILLNGSKALQHY